LTFVAGLIIGLIIGGVVGAVVVGAISKYHMDEMAEDLARYRKLGRALGRDTLARSLEDPSQIRPSDMRRARWEDDK
jgi:hypothetical protein